MKSNKTNNPIYSGVLGNKFFYLIISFVVIVIDQFSKHLFADEFLQLCNSGGIFGIKGNFGFLTVVVIILILVLFERSNKRIEIGGLALLFGGGISNLADRIYLGCVRDFVTIRNFPSFNFADFCITFGVILVFFSLVLEKEGNWK